MKLNKEWQISGKILMRKFKADYINFVSILYIFMLSFYVIIYNKIKIEMKLDDLHRKITKHYT